MKQKSGESQTDQNESDSMTESSHTQKTITDYELIDEYIGKVQEKYQNKDLSDFVKNSLMKEIRTLGTSSDSYIQMIRKTGKNYINKYFINAEYKQLSIKLNTKLPTHETMNRDFVNYLFDQKIHDQSFFIGIASSDEVFKQKIPEYVERFNATKFHILTGIVDSQIMQILEKKHKFQENRSREFLQTIDWNLKNKLVNFIYDNFTFKSLFNDFFRETLLNQFKKNIDSQYGDLKTVNSWFFDFLKIKNLSDDTISNMVMNKNDFASISESYIFEFSESKTNEVKEEVYKQFSKMARKSMNKAESERILERMKNGGVISDEDVKLVYAIDRGNPVLFAKFENTKRKIEDEDLQLQLKGLRAQVQTKMNRLLPKNREFVDKFHEHLIDQKISATELKNLVNNQRSPLYNPIFINFIATHKNIVNYAIFQNVKLNVEKNYPEMNSTAVVKQFIEKQIAKDFKIEMLFYPVQITKLIEPIMIVIKKENCETMVGEMIHDPLQERHQLDPFRVQLKENSCIPKEICFKNSDIPKREMKKQLEPYIQAIIRSVDENRFKNNINIKDEIDESIYDVIQNVLVEKGDINAICKTGFMIRINAADNFYTPELLFDSIELLRKIKWSVQDYEINYLQAGMKLGNTGGSVSSTNTNFGTSQKARENYDINKKSLGSTPKRG